MSWCFGSGGSVSRLPGNPTSDAFGRARVSNPANIFNGTNAVIDWVTNTEGMFEHFRFSSPAPVHNPLTSSVRVATNTSLSGYSIYQSKHPIIYQPGRSLQLLITFKMGAALANNIKRVGFFDDLDGIFFEQNENNGLRVVRRTNTTGVSTDFPVEQVDWNLDTLDGSGDSGNPSGILLDETKANLLIIDIAWLGVGDVRIGFDIDGTLYYVHQFNNTNVYDTVYMQSGSNRIRWECRNTLSPAATTDTYIDSICASAFSEGGRDYIGIIHGASTIDPSLRNGVVIPTLANTPKPIIGVRVRNSYYRACILPRSFSVTVDSAADFAVELWHGGTSGGNPLTVNFGDVAEVLSQDNALGNNWTITGGHVFYSSVVSVANNSSKDLNIVIPSDIMFGYRESKSTAVYPDSPYDQIAVVVTTLAAENVRGAINWTEIF